MLTGVNTTVRLLFAKQANGKRIPGLSCFTTGFPGSPNGVSPQFSLLNSNPLHKLGVMAWPSCIMRVPFQDYFLALLRKTGLLAGKLAQSSVPSAAVPPPSL